jgi:hypothetical protein
MYTHIYMWAPQATRMFTYTKIHWPTGPCHIMVQKLAHQPITPVYKIHIHQGASSTPPAAPPSGGGGGPPLPAPGGGGGAPAGPSYPGGRRPLVMAASTAARRMIDRHGGGNPIYCSRNFSSWIWIHMPSGTSQNTISKRWRISSSSTPAAVGGACDGPAPGSSKRRLLAGLLGSAGAPAASSRGLSLHAEVSPLAALAVYITPPHAHEVPNLHMHQTSNNRWYQCLYIKHMHWYIKITT